MFDATSLTTDSVVTRIRNLADQLCATLGYDAAESELAKQIEADPELVAYAISTTARREIHLSMATVRQQHIKPATTSSKAPKVYSRAVRDKVSTAGSGLLAWPLSSRKLLGDATTRDIEAEAEMYEATAQGNARNGKFMRAVATRMHALKAKPSETVRDVMDNDTLARLLAKAKAA